MKKNKQKHGLSRRDVLQSLALAVSVPGLLTSTPGQAAAALSDGIGTIPGTGALQNDTTGIMLTATPIAVEQIGAQ